MLLPGRRVEEGGVRDVAVVQEAEPLHGVVHERGYVLLIAGGAGLGWAARGWGSKSQPAALAQAAQQDQTGANAYSAGVQHGQEAKTTAPAVGTVTPQLSIAIPSITLEGDVPSDNAGKVVTTNVKFTVLDGESAASPLYISMVTADTAI